MVELARVLRAVMNETGWRPRRTIVFCSWDGEEFGLIGSSEWAEVGDNDGMGLLWVLIDIYRVEIE